MGGDDEYHSKVIIVGDGAIGKTCLLSKLTNNDVDWDDQPEYEPTTFNNFNVEWETPDDRFITMELWDTAGQEGFEQLRKLSYPGTQIYIVAYSTISRISLTNVEHKWIPEIVQNLEPNEDKPWVILCGTKADIKKDDGVSREEAEDVAQKIGALEYVETSAKTGDGIDTLIDHITNFAVSKAKNEAHVPWVKPQGIKTAPEKKEAEGTKSRKVIEDNSYATANPSAKPAAAKPSAAAANTAADPKGDGGCCVMM